MAISSSYIAKTVFLLHTCWVLSRNHAILPPGSNMLPAAQVAGAFAKAYAANGKTQVYGPLLEACNRILVWMQHKENEAVQVGERHRLAAKCDWRAAKLVGSPTMPTLVTQGSFWGKSVAGRFSERVPQPMLPCSSLLHRTWPGSAARGLPRARTPMRLCSWHSR